MEKLVVVIMGQNCEKFIGMALESVKDADSIVYCDGGSEDETYRIIGCFNENSFLPEVKVIANTYDQEDKEMNGKQRNFYLDYVKKNYPDYWCLALDADEVVQDLEKIKKFIQDAQVGAYAVKMRHFIGDLGHEDSTKETHFVDNRLFKVSEANTYPLVEHPILFPNDMILRQTDCTTIWHLGYVSGIFEVHKKYENQKKKSNMHTPEFLENWFYFHLAGHYPRKRIQDIEIPPLILRHFGIEPDAVYFSTHRTLEIKHFTMFKEWIDYFKPKNVLELGCGVGLWGTIAEYLDIEYLGMDKSEFAIRKSPIKNMMVGNILDKQDFKDYDLVLVLDILEHLREEDLDKALDNIQGYGKSYLFSIPYENDPNIDEDPTHLIKKSKEWWLEKLSKYFIIEDVPKEWGFSKQMLMGREK